MVMPSSKGNVKFMIKGYVPAKYGVSIPKAEEERARILMHRQVSDTLCSLWYQPKNSLGLCSFSVKWESPHLILRVKVHEQMGNIWYNTQHILGAKYISVPFFKKLLVTYSGRWDKSMVFLFEDQHPPCASTCRACFLIVFWLICLNNWYKQ